MKTSTLKKLDGVLTILTGSSLGVTIANFLRNKDLIYLLFFIAVFIPFIAGKLIIRHTLKRREQKQLSDIASSEPNDLNESQAARTPGT